MVAWTAWLAVGYLAVGCSLDDSADTECRCTESSDANLFPQCVDAVFTERPDNSNPFATRLPDCPSGRTLFLREPTRPVNVLLNVQTTLRELSPSQYLDQLSDDFLFIPDPGDIDLHPEVYEVPPNYNPDLDTLWNREQERRYAFSLLDPDRVLKPEFIRWYSASRDEIEPSEDGLRERFIFDYEIDFIEVLTQEEGQDESRLLGIKGRMHIDLVTPSLENPVWSIQRWRDERVSGTTKLSWGELRAVFSP
ncbi:MAG: hypothetical protein GKR89_11355 [Candidatus Latescibacteria bacterium]|nr:hypothetical protein [Candidatus Latescibacterota bacterium]